MARWCCTSSPEAAAGGPLGLVRTGDFVILDVAGTAARHRHSRGRAGGADTRRGDRRRLRETHRGWERLYVDTVQQANTGADLDFLVGSTGDRVSRESH